METDCIHFKETGYFSNIILDYLEGDEKLSPFYQYAPSLNSFNEAIEKKSLPISTRSILKTSIEAQYTASKINLSKFEKVETNLNSLLNEGTYTICTGHQLCLFTGPLYFIYKIVSTVKLSQQLKAKFPKQNFVPVYWMATEDHDFPEINHFRLGEQKFEWNTTQKGAVGRMKLDGLEEVFDSFSKSLGTYSSNAEELKTLFQKAYLKHENLADATRYLVNELFADYGVVIVDGDAHELKRLFAPVVKEELLTEFSSHQVERQSKTLAANYKIQVNPREINLFYLTDGSRERILKENDTYFINETGQSFTETEILQELEAHPERFSPNVLLRPLYQEIILPNLGYIGGGGELAYWFQLKSSFDQMNTPFPMLLLRNSALWMDEKQGKYFKKLGISLAQLFLEEGVLLKAWVKQNAEEELTLSAELKETEKQFENLLQKAGAIDASLNAHVEAVKVKQEKAIQQLSEKMIRAERRQQGEAANRIQYLKSTLFPNRGLQERSANFSEIYVREGKGMIEKLLENFAMPTQEFNTFFE